MGYFIFFQEFGGGLLVEFAKVYLILHLIFFVFEDPAIIDNHLQVGYQTLLLEQPHSKHRKFTTRIDYGNIISPSQIKKTRKAIDLTSSSSYLKH